MKKRRELDALIGNRAKKENPEGHFEYDSLNSSLSSPTADLYMPPNYYSTTKRISRTSANGCGCTLRKLIRICLPVCFLSLVAACITACIGIVWMQVQLKTDVDKLKDQVSKLETWQVQQPLSMDDMKKTIVDLTKDVNMVQDGELGIKNLAEKLAFLKEQFEEQQKVPTEKFKQLESDSSIIKVKVDSLEAKVDELKSQSSKSKTSQELLSVSYNKLKDTVDSMQSKVSADDAKHLESVESVKQSIMEKIAKINQTVQQMSKNVSILDEKIEFAKNVNANALSKIEQSIGLLQQQSDRPSSTEAPINMKNMKPIETQQKFNEPTGSKNRPKTAGKSGSLQRVTSKPVSTDAPAEPKIAKPEAGFSIIVNETIGNNDSSKNVLPPKFTSLSEIISDVKATFEAIDVDGNGSLSQKELENSYNKRTALELLQFDSNKDGVLSRTEVDYMQSPIETSNREDSLPGR